MPSFVASTVRDAVIDKPMQLPEVGRLEPQFFESGELL
jgi:hypothetical protein